MDQLNLSLTPSELESLSRERQCTTLSHFSLSISCPLSIFDFFFFFFLFLRGSKLNDLHNEAAKRAYFNIHPSVHPSIPQPDYDQRREFYGVQSEALPYFEYDIPEGEEQAIHVPRYHSIFNILLVSGERMF